MIKLEDLLLNLKVNSIIGYADLDLTGIAMDSRKVEPGFLFVAVKGVQTDGHQFIETAIANGARAIVVENLPKDINAKITFILVSDSTEALGFLANQFYNQPSHQFILVGVTGTNGKTTVASLLFQLFRDLGFSCGLISTVQNLINERVIPATHTTPDAVSLNALMRDMADAGCKYVFMECSSHAIHQNRIAGLQFAGAIFTNITHDHLDYHKTFAEYLKAKKKFFDQLNLDAFALTNKDDKNGLVMLQNTKATKYTYALQSMSDFRIRIIEQDFNGMLLNIDGSEIWVRLTGEFNAYNVLAVYATAFLLGLSKEDILMGLSKLKPVSGRFDYQQSADKVTGIVDYAHTPDALQNVLETINKIRTHNEELITIIGCGGDRDKTKRPLMAKVACELSSKVILTSDNPRSEEPETILDDMERGVPALHYKKVLRIADRKEAIRTAVSISRKGDIILLAGKGHENYQEIKGVKQPFDDKELLKEFFEKLKSK